MRVFSFPPLNCDLSISLSLPPLLSYTLIGKEEICLILVPQSSFCHLAAHHPTNSGHKYHFQQFGTTDHALMGLPWVLSYPRIFHLHIRGKVNMRCASLFVTDSSLYPPPHHQNVMVLPEFTKGLRNIH